MPDREKKAGPPKRSLLSRALQAGDAVRPLPSISPPIVQSTIFELRDAAHGAELSAATAPPAFYTRWGNPTTRQAETILAELEQGEACLVTSSGMGAISSTILSFLKSGDHVVAGRALYAGTTELLSEVLPRFGVEVDFVDQTDLDQVRAAVRDETRILYVETLTNPTLHLADLDGLAAIARAAGLISMIDSTFATPANVRPIEHGFNLVLHSLTKYLNGHSDLIGGAVIGMQASIDRIWYHTKILGPSMSPFESWLLIRGLKSFTVRMERHNRNGAAIAAFLAGHSKVEAVHYPGLTSHPQHELAARLLSGYGGMVSFEVRGGVEAGRRLIEAVQLIKLAVSLGGTESLIIHPSSTTHAMIPRATREAAGITDGLIRLSVGIEEIEDLVADLESAFEQV